MPETAGIVPTDERVMDVIHRHWMAQLPISLAFSFVSFLFLYGVYYFSVKDNAPGMLLMFVLFMCNLGFLAASYYVHRCNRLILTDKTLYEIQQYSVFSQKVSRFSLERLQDVSYRRSGITATALNYGEVDVQTAGTEENFIFTWAPKPKRVSELIMETHKYLIDQKKERENLESQEEK